MRQANEIAKSLTKAQRRVVVAGFLALGGRGYWPLRNTLLDKGLIEYGVSGHVLTQLGREVRDLIGGAGDE